MDNIITIKDLTKSYGKHRGIENVSFEVKRGEIFGYLGSNGAGKSTTIRSMLGLLHYEKGEIQILGYDVKTNKEKILSKVGYMPSEAWFHEGMSVKDVIKLSADVRKKDCWDEAMRLCDCFQVDTKRKIQELSLGNRKKVSIICAMQHKPELFVFDEPTSGLDPLMQNVFFDLVKEYVRAGATCMLSTHVLSEVRKYCDRVAIMKEGKLMIKDTVDNLTKSHTKRIRMVRNGEHLDYLYHGSLDDIYLEFKDYHIEDITIEEPSIEDIFMKYYEKEWES